MNPMAFVGTVEMKLVVTEKYDHIDLIVLKHIGRCIERKCLKLIARCMSRKLIKLNSKEKKDFTPSDIFYKVCQYLNTNKEQAELKIQKRDMVEARQISHFFSKQLTKCSLSTIGREIGGKDHATCLFSIKQVKNHIETDKEFRKKISEIEKILKS